MKAKVTISKMSGNGGVGLWSISITDAASRLNIVRVEMSLEDFSECLGGLSECSADISRVVNDGNIHKIGRKKETKRLSMEWDNRGYEKDELKDLIARSIPDGWELWDDGTRSQQNTHMRHNFTVCRYMEKS